MSDKNEPSHSEILAEVKSLGVRLEERRTLNDSRHTEDIRRHEKLEKTVYKMDARLQKVEGVTQFGRGIGWLLLRIGAIVTGAIVVWETIKNHIKLP